MSELHERFVERVRRNGPLRFDDLVEAALYDPAHGFFTSGEGAAGRADGDFITSPEVGPLFGAVVAAALDSWWDQLGRPDPFVVVEAGAGRGALAVSVLHAQPECSGALRYVLVESSPVLRARQAEHLDLQLPANGLGPVTVGHHDEEPSLTGDGPVVVSVPDLPPIKATGVVLANELLDNLPFRLLERDDGEWREVMVGADGDELVETTVAAHPSLAGRAATFAPDAPDGARVPIQQPAVSWLRDAIGLLEKGRVVVFDYASTTAELAARPWTDWCRTYRRHERGTHPLEDLGRQDITCEVAVDQLGPVRRPSAQADQADWLRSHGLDELVAEGTALWEATAAAPDLAALEGRSRIAEAAALAASPGLGAHRVVEWRVR